ncbi:MAG: helix-hairpin-helix domain-containing protein [Bacteroidetes bacterium]|nr:helix-hairpin-helix domain-containing protein [Bacteroidota bacterium]
MKQLLKDYLTFTKREQRGIFILSCLVFLVILGNTFTPLFIRREKFDFSTFETEIAAFYQAVEATESRPDTLNSNKKFNVYPKSQAGLPAVQSLKQNEIIVEINSADSATFDKLRGIGPKFAQRIIKYRDLLGGYYCREQLLEVYGMDSARLMPIWQNIYADTGLIRKLDINKASFSELLRHPYLEMDVVKAITRHREKSGDFHSIGELLDLKLVNDSIYRRTRPYLMVRDTL